MARVSKQIFMLEKLKELGIDLDKEVLDKSCNMAVFNSIKSTNCFEECQSL